MTSTHASTTLATVTLFPHPPPPTRRTPGKHAPGILIPLPRPTPKPLRLSATAEQTADAVQELVTTFFSMGADARDDALAFVRIRAQKG
jgi:hypothetical protein